MANPTPALSPNADAREIMSLSATVRNMDQYAQGALSQIAAIADLSLLSLETPEGIRDTENIAAALTAIWETATNMRDLINSEASDVGCSYQDSALRRRRAAKSAAGLKGGDVPAPG